MSEVIVVTSGKGGVGKTTSTANIGMGLAQMDKRVVMIDTDIGLRNLDVVLGLENRDCLQSCGCCGGQLPDEAGANPRQTVRAALPSPVCPDEGQDKRNARADEKTLR